MPQSLHTCREALRPFYGLNLKRLLRNPVKGKAPFKKPLMSLLCGPEAPLSRGPSLSEPFRNIKGLFAARGKHQKLTKHAIQDYRPNGPGNLCQTQLRFQTFRTIIACIPPIGPTRDSSKDKSCRCTAMSDEEASVRFLVIAQASILQCASRSKMPVNNQILAAACTPQPSANEFHCKPNPRPDEHLC